MFDLLGVGRSPADRPGMGRVDDPHTPHILGKPYLKSRPWPKLIHPASDPIAEGAVPLRQVAAHPTVERESLVRGGRQPGDVNLAQRERIELAPVLRAADARVAGLPEIVEVQSGRADAVALAQDPRQELSTREIAQVADIVVRDKAGHVTDLGEARQAIHVGGSARPLKDA